jgi:hypothetical protein
MRTSFTNEQLDRLEKEFSRQQYMVGSERFLLASGLQLTEAQVQTRFQLKLQTFFGTKAKPTFNSFLRMRIRMIIRLAPTL